MMAYKTTLRYWFHGILQALAMLALAWSFFTFSVIASLEIVKRWEGVPIWVMMIPGGIGWILFSKKAALVGWWRKQGALFLMIMMVMIGFISIYHDQWGFALIVCLSGFFSSLWPKELERLIKEQENENKKKEWDVK